MKMCELKTTVRVSSLFSDFEKEPRRTRRARRRKTTFAFFALAAVQKRDNAVFCGAKTSVESARMRCYKCRADPLPMRFFHVLILLCLDAVRAAGSQASSLTRTAGFQPVEAGRMPARRVRQGCLT